MCLFEDEMIISTTANFEMTGAGDDIITMVSITLLNH